MITEAKKKYLKEYRQKNKEHIRKVSQARYLRNREHDLEKSKEWQQNNKDRVNARQRRVKAENKELERVRDKTKNSFRELKKKSKCKKCPSKDNLEFHHLEPLAYDNFDILCRNCHREVHGKLLVRNDSFEQGKAE